MNNTPTPRTDAVCKNDFVSWEEIAGRIQAVSQQLERELSGAYDLLHRTEDEKMDLRADLARVTAEREEARGKLNREIEAADFRERDLRARAESATPAKHDLPPRFHGSTSRIPISDYLRDYANAIDIGESQEDAQHAQWLRKAANAIEAAPAKQEEAS